MATSLSIGTGSGGAGVSTTTLLAQLTFNGQAEAINYVLTNNNSPLYFEKKSLVGVAGAGSGQNTITVPSKAGGVFIVPNAHATYRMEITTSAWVSAVILNTLAPTFIPFHTTPPSYLYIKWNGAGRLAGSVTVDAGTDVFSYTAHGFADGDQVTFGGTALPGGINAGQWYYIVNKATDTFKVAASQSGSAIDITSAGTAVTVTSADEVGFLWV